MVFKFLIISSILLLSLCNRSELYEGNKSNVINLNPKNFDNQITSNRAKNIISLIHYYTLEDGKSHNYKTELDKIATDYEGMFKITALNCRDYKQICEKEDVREYPTIKIYPQLPAPIMIYEGKVEANAIISYLGRFLGNVSTELNNNNIDTFITENVNLPKLLLFTDKKGVPSIFKALSVSFDKKINFGIVRSEDTGITQKYKIKKFPTIMAIGTDKKQKVYEGENKYKLLFDWINVFSETFFRVGEDKTKASEVTKADKPWLNEKLPELTKESANEICFRVDGVICVILTNKEKPSDELVNLFSNLQNYLSPKIDRGGIKYKFGWINTTTQSNFINYIELEDISNPHFILINPGKRKRYFIYDGALEQGAMSN